MSSSNKKIIAIVGATGIQGGSVARTFLGLAGWHVRCLTRNSSSAAAEALRASGAEVMQADLTDLPSLSRAFENANAIFLNTDFWTTFKPAFAGGMSSDEASKLALAAESSQGKNAVIAAAGVPTLERFVYSAFISMKAVSKGKYYCGHFEAKAMVVDYIEHEQPELLKKTSFFYPGGYNTNALLIPTKDPATGELSFNSPVLKTRKFPIFDPAQTTGLCVRALIEEEAPGTRLLGVDTDSNLTMLEVADVWSRVTGKNVIYNEVSLEAMQQKTGIPLEILHGIGFANEYDYTEGAKTIEPAQLKCHLKTKTFEEWLRDGKVDELLQRKPGAGSLRK